RRRRQQRQARGTAREHPTPSATCRDGARRCSSSAPTSADPRPCREPRTAPGPPITQAETPEAQIPALFSESQSYYLLAFSPADGKADGKFHNLSVKVNRPDV